MTGIIVQKYGGACLATPARIVEVASAIAEKHRRGLRPVVVVSAMGQSTDELIKLAYAVSPHPNRRELDMLLTTGERVSMSLMSMALSDLGVPAISFTGSQAGLMTDGSHSQARLTDVKPLRVLEELERGRVVVLAGFQGVHPQTKEITTLGRGGSDTTAVAMAAALKADRCEIVKEVDGVCSGDPRVIANARPLREVDYACLSEMCYWGAKVLHFRSVELAERQNINLVISKWGQAADASRIHREVLKMESGTVLSVNSLKTIEHIGIEAANLSEGYFKLSEHLKLHNLAWPQLLASAYDSGKLRVMVASDDESLSTLMHTLQSSAGLARLRAPMSSVSLTCFGAVASDLPMRALEVLRTAEIIPEKFLFSPHSMSVVLRPEQREAAIRALHAEFIQ